MIVDSKPVKTSSKIKNAIADVVLSSTSHGIPNVVRSPRPSLKILWTLSTVVSAGFCCYLITQNIMSYLNFDVTTTIRVKKETSSLFPTITLCNLNAFTTDYTVNTFIKSFSPDVKNMMGYFPWLNFYLSTIMNNDLQMNRSMFGDSKEKLLVESYFDVLLINQSELSYYFHPLYGNCYQFNSGKDQNGNEIALKRVTKNDRITGFRSVLNVSIHPQIKEYVYDIGAVLMIHNSSISPFSVHGITLGANIITNIEISRQFSKQQPKPYSNCDGDTDKIENFDSDIYKLILEKNVYYTQKYCIAQCYQRELANKCNCSDAAIESIFDKQACNFTSKCANETFNTFFEASYIEKTCMPICPLECEEMIFKKVVSIQTVDYEKEEFKDLAFVNVYYENIGYTEIEETPTTTIVSLISNIGGIAGLFLGVSFLSLVELVEILFQVFYILIEKKKNLKVSV